jgi:alkylation response protein AidB-like acyl-CoA dehydrogenase
MEALLYANRRLIYGLAEAIDKDERDSTEALSFGLQAQTVKYLTTTNSIRAVEIGLELTGSSELMRKYPLERHYRDVLCSQIYTPKMTQFAQQWEK